MWKTFASNYGGLDIIWIEVRYWEQSLKCEGLLSAMTKTKYKVRKEGKEEVCIVD
jgi:hypothetical protein